MQYSQWHTDFNKYPWRSSSFKETQSLNSTFQKKVGFLFSNEYYLKMMKNYFVLKAFFNYYIQIVVLSFLVM